ncbi:hypothetical protein RFI_05873 [Reticulomyxa filosa]|uniref:Uncharacterized protein n=1 Tax=Reticulomyxa filosa TaxID=46433 RepID=X6NZD9_RETFI|nr:hypothetical protein RFI_05873 [Reticulomyxa filosa]|eukprot:ETO31248.1 hypothetical protein RFI_05873 [Reticulomyxa filosa]
MFHEIMQDLIPINQKQTQSSFKRSAQKKRTGAIFSNMRQPCYKFFQYSFFLLPLMYSQMELTGVHSSTTPDKAAERTATTTANTHTLWPPDINLFKFISYGILMESAVNSILYPLFYCKTHLQTNVGELSGNALKDLYNQTNTIVKEFGFKEKKTKKFPEFDCYWNKIFVMVWVDKTIKNMH